jgi:ornithine cyclodeaminase/alanine dehydrogenase-like protein (mu-crystallin family)
MDQIVGELADVVNGKTGRRRNDEISLCEAVGTGWQDLVVVAAVLAGVES